jgi:hypothetical protein
MQQSSMPVTKLAGGGERVELAASDREAFRHQFSPSRENPIGRLPENR